MFLLYYTIINYIIIEPYKEITSVFPDIYGEARNQYRHHSGQWESVGLNRSETLIIDIIK